MNIRQLSCRDFYRGYLPLLSQLSDTVGETISHTQFMDRCIQIKDTKNTFIFVLYDNIDNIVKSNTDGNKDEYISEWNTAKEKRMVNEEKDRDEDDEEFYKEVIIGSATVIIDHKFIHHLGNVGHIEDIVINSHWKGEGLGKIIISYIEEVAKKYGCYKTILHCNDDVRPFYQKCKYNDNGNQSMSKYF